MSAPDTPRQDDELARAVELLDSYAEINRTNMETARKAIAEIVKLRRRTCPTCRHHTHDEGDHWCALGISTAGRVPGLVTHLQPFGCSKHEGKGAGDDE